MPSLKLKIFDYLKAREGVWVNGKVIEDRASAIGKKASNASRRCRELSKESGYIQRRINGKSVEYRYVNPNLAKPEAYELVGQEVRESWENETEKQETKQIVETLKLFN